MAVTIVVRSGVGDGGDALSLTLDSPMIVLGRGESCDVRLPDPSVSHRHATIRQRGSEHIVMDEGSANGTFIGGVRLGAQAPRMLRHGDVVRMGRVFVEVRFDAPMATSQPAQATKELALALVARALDAQGEPGGPRLIVRDGPDLGKLLLLDLPGRAYVLGRGKDTDLVLDDADASRRHVQVVRRGDQVLVKDLGSKNRAELAGSPLGDRDTVWRVGDELHVGGNVLVYQHPAVEALGELERAADEKMRADEVVTPPPGTAGSRTADADAAARDAGAAAPIAEVPRASVRPRAKAAQGWNGTDFLVVLLALGVIALSVVGLFWLFKS